MKLSVTINGESRAVEIAGSETLLDMLRGSGYFGVKRGCDNGDCGACAVLVDGKAVCSCIMLAGQVHARNVTTIEGLGDPLSPHPLQKTFVDCGAAQCGFCIPGMIVSAKELLDTHPQPTDEEMSRYLDGVLCRCTGYTKQFEAIRQAAAILRDGAAAGASDGTRPGKTGPATFGADHRTGPPPKATATPGAATSTRRDAAPRGKARAKGSPKAKTRAPASAKEPAALRVRARHTTTRPPARLRLSPPSRPAPGRGKAVARPGAKAPARRAVPVRKAGAKAGAKAGTTARSRTPGARSPRKPIRGRTRR